MKALIFVTLFICQGWAIAPDVITEPLVGAKQCTWGPSYWCSNLTAAAGCNAVKHCIQTVWEHQQLPRDTDTVCQTCLKMVKEARDQLLSNETEGEIEEVFEGSCKLIPVKIVSKECCKLVDDFIPELIDTLASQMNPQVVCSVAGLCNNARVDGLIEEYESEANAPTEPPNTCEGCQTVITILEQKLERMSKDDVLQSFLQICGHMGSLSDACSNIVVTYFPEIYEHLDKNFNPTDVCLMTGECSAQFHTHANVEITPLSKVGFVPVEAKDDLPCELCEQLVTHLRELLIANTTETEFQRVLEGLCKQTKTFKDECLSIVDQYYGTIYNFLVSELNSTVACSMIGICPPPNYADQNAPIVPLLPVESAPKALELMNNNEASNEGPAIEIAAKPETMQLPIERIFVPHLQETYNKQVCVFCEYFLHYVQEAITTPRTVDEIKHFIDKACEKFPTSINETCINFVNTYGDAVVALLAQEIDPSTICPLIRACPSSDAKNVEVFAEETGNKENCPMCLFAVTELEQMVKNDKTKNNIKAALNKLCSHLSDKVAAECQDFVNTYTDTLVELMIADLTPQEVCVFLKLCDDKMPAKPLVVVMEEVEDHDLLTNEIPDFTVNGQYIIDVPSKPGSNNKPQCVICEFAMTKLQSLLKNKTTEEEIKEAVVNICNHLPKSVRGECTSFVNKYADLVIELLIGAMEPDEICAYIGLCDKKPRISKVVPLENAESMQTEKVGSPQCVICKLIMNQIEKYIIGTTTKEEIVSALYGICAILPRREEDSCNEFVRQHGNQIAELILLAAEPSEICSLMFICTYQQELLQHEIQQCALCQAAYFNYIFLSELKEDVTVRNICAPMTQDYKMECYKMFKLNKRGLFGRFGEEDSADACRKLDYCEGETQYLRLRRDLVGSNRCTWGPSYWCASKSNAEECGSGAVDHCNEKGWNVSRKRRQLVGSNKCTWGPGYWCASESNAQECDAVEHCTRNNWSVSRKRRQLVGSNKCTWGPGYWCASESNAQECDAVEHCTRNNWSVSRKRRQLVGSNKCTWGPGYWCASESNAQECDAVEHCTRNNWSVSRKRRQLVGSNKCTWGPGYWCASKSNAEECGPGAVDHCNEKGWNVSRKRRQVLGAEKCTWGPGYWCASEANAQECDAVEHCTKNNWSVSRKRRQLVGSNKCTWGPGYWCASESNAQECDAVEHCTRNNWSVSRKRRQLVGSNKCTWGPGYWCASESNAQECDAVEHCTRNNWSVSRKRRQLVGSNKCTWGPGYWCASKSNAEECGPGAVDHCNEKGWNVSRKRRQLPGAQKCTWGPSYWCASKSNAEECGPGAVDHCNEKGWNVSRKRRQVLGAEKCTWGPGYWCASESNAQECDAVEHCSKHGYNLSRERREVLVGSNKCTWGPAYWCASASNAKECGPEAVEHCQIIRKRRETLLGSKRCTWGPSYWCSNLANAQECNALEHCHNKVWKGSAPSS